MLEASFKTGGKKALKAGDRIRSEILTVGQGRYLRLHRHQMHVDGMGPAPRDARQGGKNQLQGRR